MLFRSKALDGEYYEEFGKEARNIRLGASTDGLNPFGNQRSCEILCVLMQVVVYLDREVPMRPN